MYLVRMLVALHTSQKSVYLSRTNSHLVQHVAPVVPSQPSMRPTGQLFQTENVHKSQKFLRQQINRTPYVRYQFVQEIVI